MYCIRIACKSETFLYTAQCLIICIKVYTTSLLVNRGDVLQLLNPFGVQVRRVYGHHFGGQERMDAEQQALKVLTYQFL